MSSFKEILYSLREYPATTRRQPLLDLVDELRRYRGTRQSLEEKLDELIQLLQTDAEADRIFHTYLNKQITSKNFIRLLTESGISPRHGFFSELFGRIGDKIFPLVSDKSEALDLLEDMFDHRADHEWVNEIATEKWALLFDQLNFKREKYDFVADSFYEPVTTSMLIIGNRIASLGMQPQIITRLPHFEQYNSPFLALSVELNQFIHGLSGNKWSADELKEWSRHITVLISQCKENSVQLWKVLKKRGVSLDLVYSLTQINQLLTRLPELLNLIVPEAEKSASIHTAQLFKELVTAQHLKHSIRVLLRSNTQLLAYQVVERNSHTGEHYITNTAREYYIFLLQSMGGGLIVAFITWMKYAIHDLHAPPLTEGVLNGFNYAVGFIIIYAAHFTLATKQPAMTASALASSLEEKTVVGQNLSATANLIVKMVRSQFVSFIGNLCIVFPAAWLIAYGYYSLTGQLIVDTEYAAKSINDLHPFKSFSIFYAAIAGFWLYVSGLITGYFDNRIDIHQIPRRIRDHQWLKKRLPLRVLIKISRFTDNNLGSLAGNFFLGFLLALTTTFGVITGLPIDVRHVTLSTGNFAMSFFSLGSHIPLSMMLFTLLGILFIGTMNLAVSFGLAFFTAMRSRQVNFMQSRELIFLVLGHFWVNPGSFFFPVKEKKQIK